ncbi:MAG TPA: aromatic ring-hydroxylating dioxygenase subunit alpha, partial [Acidimicrobiales bacterium]
MTRETLPASWYRGDGAYDAERASVFGRTWQLVARASELARAGDYVASTIAGWPIVVVAGEDASLRAFHDVCLHRGGPLVRDAKGNCGASLVCGYHGWTYALDGSLVRARDFGEEMAGRGLALHPIRVEAWRGLVFVNLDGDAPPLVDALGGFAEACRDLPLEDFAFDGEQVHEIQCNWKTYADNYLEGYHIPVVHPELDEVIDSRRYEVAVHDDGRWCRHTAPARGDGELDATSGVWLW